MAEMLTEQEILERLKWLQSHHGETAETLRRLLEDRLAHLRRADLLSYDDGLEDAADCVENREDCSTEEICDSIRAMKGPKPRAYLKHEE